MTAAARIDATARVLLDHVDRFVRDLGTDKLRVEMQRSEAEKGLHALAVLEAINPKLDTLAHAHDMLAAALNVARPDAPLILSMATLEPATCDGAGQSIPPDPLHPHGMTVELHGRFTAAGLRQIADGLDQGRAYK